MEPEKYKSLYKELSNIVPKDRIYVDEVRKLAIGTDASFYRLIPHIVIQSSSEQEISETLLLCNKYQTPVTFRAAGTSLSGQSITDSVLLLTGNKWENYSISDDAETITVQCGMVGARVNEILSKYHKKIGPDPASINSAMVGGIVMNNASGMNCGVRENSYQTILGARIIFADGSLLDTGSPESCDHFKQTHPKFIEQIEALKTKIRSDKNVVDRIKRKYTIKNTTGLSMNAFVDYDDPIRIILKLLVGSEGTLAFGSEFTFRTITEPVFRASAMIYFPDIVTACEAVVKMKKGNVYSAELLDRLALRAVQGQDGIPEFIKDFDENVTAILVETKADTQKQLNDHIETIISLIQDIPTLNPVYFTDKPEEYNKFWKIRNGVLPSVGGMRPKGTTTLIEDVAFHLEDLPSAVADLRKLLDRHGYTNGVIYGHALEGNMHFIIDQRFDSPEEVKRYKAFINDIVELVVQKFDGSLKAEHGTGRNMAPFVRVEWGDEIFGLMKEVKKIFDPKGLLNPGVIFNEDPECFLQHTKAMTAFNEHVDQCIECGFCEVNCVTNGFSLSSRQRIVVQREMARLRNNQEDVYRLNLLEAGFDYLGEQTCAGDGLCSTSCPIGINTGEMIHDLRAAKKQKFPAKQLGNFTARDFHLITPLVYPGLSLLNTTHAVLGTKLMTSFSKGLRSVSAGKIPLWTPAMPMGRKRPVGKFVDKENPLKVVYFPSCINQTMGPSRDDPEQMPLVEKMVQLFQKAGYEVVFPENMKQLCCGTIWESKGFLKDADEKSGELEAALLKASENGRYPVLCDQSPCLYRMRRTMKSPLRLFEPVEFIVGFLSDKLKFVKTDDAVSVHVTCSMKKMGLGDELIKLANMCSSNVLVPDEIGCCAFAGDKGFTHPEINKYALRKLRPQIEKYNIKYGYSNSRTCEIGLTTHSGISYQSIVYLVDRCTEKLDVV